MPALSLVVCVNNQRDLLGRLLQKAGDCFDDLVVVHDGSDATNVRSLVDATGGRFYVRSREHQQEPHWPFAWEQAAHDWILRLDADEFPGDEMKQWLCRFRQAVEPNESVSGYTCIWPIWNGIRAVTERWPAGRIFLFNRRRVRFFGIAEQTPIPDVRYEALPLILNHQPLRRSHGLRNILFRKQAYAWRSLIGRGLLGKPTDLPCWRWNSEIWPERWEEVRRNPVRIAFSRLLLESLRTFRDQWKNERRILFTTGLNGPFHHAIFCIQYWWLRQSKKAERSEKLATNTSE